MQASWPSAQTMQSNIFIRVRQTEDCVSFMGSRGGCRKGWLFDCLAKGLDESYLETHFLADEVKV